MCIQWFISKEAVELRNDALGGSRPKGWVCQELMSSRLSQVLGLLMLTCTTPTNFIFVCISEPQFSLLEVSSSQIYILIVCYRHCMMWFLRAFSTAQWWEPRRALGSPSRVVTTVNSFAHVFMGLPHSV